MKTIVVLLLTFILSWLRSRRSMQMEIVSLRHQLCVYQRSFRQPIIEPEDRVIWSWIVRQWSGWKEALIFVQPRTVMAWQRKRFRAHWAKFSQAGKPRNYCGLFDGSCCEQNHTDNSTIENMIVVRVIIKYLRNRIRIASSLYAPG